MSEISQDDCCQHIKDQLNTSVSSQQLDDVKARVDECLIADSLTDIFTLMKEPNLFVFVYCSFYHVIQCSCIERLQSRKCQSKAEHHSGSISRFCSFLKEIVFLRFSRQRSNPYICMGESFRNPTTASTRRRSYSLAGDAIAIALSDDLRNTFSRRLKDYIRESEPISPRLVFAGPEFFDHELEFVFNPFTVSEKVVTFFYSICRGSKTERIGPRQFLGALRRHRIVGERPCPVSVNEADLAFIRARNPLRTTLNVDAFERALADIAKHAFFDDPYPLAKLFTLIDFERV